MGFFFISYPEQGCLQYIQMSLPHQFRKELQEEGHQQQPDMHAVHIGIGGNHHIVVPQVFQSVLNIQCSLQQVEFLVLVYDLFGKSEDIQWLAFQAEYSLCAHIPCRGDGTAGRIAFGDEHGGIKPAFIIVIEMDLAVTQFAVMQA